MLFDEEMMLLALEEAKKAAELGDVPVGAVIVDGNGEVLASGYNVRESQQRPTGHAEMVVIEKAAELRGSRRLEDCTLYVTLEPCPMCAGAVINARLRRVVYGAFHEEGGACSSVTDLFSLGFGHRPLVRSRILQKECSELLTGFFRDKRDPVE